MQYYDYYTKGKEICQEIENKKDCERIHSLFLGYKIKNIQDPV